MTIGQRLKQQREELNISLRKLSEMTGIPTSSIRDYENDKYDPPISKTLKLSIALKCSIIWIATGKDKEELNLTKKELEVLKIFNLLDEKDKQEIYDYLEFKLTRLKKNSN